MLDKHDPILPARPTVEGQREDQEHLRQVDLPESEGGGHVYIEQTEGDKQKQQKEKIDDVNSFLEGERQRAFTYRSDLANYGNGMLPDILDKGWEGRFLATDGSLINLYNRSFKSKEGLVLVLKYKDEVYIRAIRTTRDSQVDTNAVRVMCEQAENTIDSRKGILLSDKKNQPKKTKGGVYLE
jgi:hypothetical protein